MVSCAKRPEDGPQEVTSVAASRGCASIERLARLRSLSEWLPLKKVR